MGRADTGLSNNSPNDNEVAPNRDLEHPGRNEDSDSDIDETEEDPLGQYMPLSQNPNDGEPFYEPNNDSEDEIMVTENESSSDAGITNTSLPDLPDVDTALVKEVWKSPTPKEVDIELSEKKIDLVKQVMVNIHLPSEAIPDWAKNIPEEEWKNHLLKRLNKGNE